jgi:hypothetical protein
VLPVNQELLLDGTFGYTEPPAWYFPVRHVLGAVLIEAGRPAEAEVIYWRRGVRSHIATFSRAARLIVTVSMLQCET